MRYTIEHPVYKTSAYAAKKSDALRLAREWATAFGETVLVCALNGHTFWLIRPMA